MLFNHIQSAGFDPEPGAAHCEGRGEPGHEGAAGCRHIQHHAGHALSGQHSHTHCPPRLSGAAGQHPAASATGATQRGFPAGQGYVMPIPTHTRVQV